MKVFVLALALSTLSLSTVARAAEPIDDGTVAFALPPEADTSHLATRLMRLAGRLESSPGVSSVEVRLAKRDVLVRYDPDATGVPSLVTVVEALGYRAHSKRQAEVAAAK